MAQEQQNQEPIIGYCLKCKEKRTIVNPQAEWTAGGAPGTRGTCPVCGGTIYKTGRTPAHEHLPKPEVKATKSRGKGKGKTKAKARGKSSARSTSSADGKRRGRLVIVESPAKARTIGRYLGRGYTVKSSVGHVRDLLKSRL